MRDLNELQVFVAVGRTESFTRAARQLSLTKSAVSRAVASLEKRLRANLLTRTTRSVTLTEIGRFYLTQCERMLEEADLADQLIGQLQAIPQGTLSVSAPVAFTHFLLGPLIPKFLSAYPEIDLRVELSHGPSLGPVDQFDIQVRPGPLEDSGLYAKALTQTTLKLYAAPSVLKRQSIRDPEDLKQVRCVVSNCGPHGEPNLTALWSFRRDGHERKIKVSARVSIADPALNLRYALEGLGPALIGVQVAAPFVEIGELVELLPGWEVPPVKLYALYPSRLHSSPRVRALVDFLSHYFAIYSDTKDCTLDQTKTVKKTKRKEAGVRTIAGARSRVRKGK